jgi:hypothetical protein
VRRVSRVALTLGLLLLPVLGPTQGTEVHGENSVFAAPGVVLVWGVLRGQTEDATLVVCRVTAVGLAYTHVGVDAVDPFSQARTAVLAAHPIVDGLDVRSPRGTFADFPRREIRLYRSADDARTGHARLTVYYLGVPDTTPEFAGEPALRAYLADAVAKARSTAGNGTP